MADRDVANAGRSWSPDATRNVLIAEVLIVLALSLGRSAVSSIVNLLADLSSTVPLSQQTTVLNDSLAPDRPMLDLVRQIMRIVFALAPVALVWYLLRREGSPGLRTLGVDRTDPARDLGRGAALAALVGGVGLLGYVLAHRAGISLTVVAAGLPDQWWRGPILVAAALMAATLEETIVVGYLLLRLRQIGVGPTAAIGTSALLRAAYHSYQGFGAMLGNLAMGLLFAWLFQRWGRVMPLIIAHALIDIVAFIGYAALAGKAEWIPMVG